MPLAADERDRSVPLGRVGPDADLLGGPADLLLLGKAEHFDPARVDVDETAALDVGNDQGGGAGMEGLGEALLAQAEQFLGLLALGYIPADADDFPDFPVRSEDCGVVPGEPSPAVHGHGALLQEGRMRRHEEGLHGLPGGLPVVVVDQGHERPAQQFLLAAAENAAVGRTGVQETPLGIDLDHQVGLVLDEKAVVVLPLDRRPQGRLQLRGLDPDFSAQVKVPGHDGGQCDRKAREPEKDWDPDHHGQAPYAARHG
ncbi:hypothetical protein DSECCO2_486640 [anaerobic digester metagenome]